MLNRPSAKDTSAAVTKGAAQQKEVLYTNASDELIRAREEIALYSFEAAHERILTTKRVRESDALQAEEDKRAALSYIHQREMVLSASQYGDDRPITTVRYAPDGKRFAAGSLSCMVKLWNSSSLANEASLRGHQERITSLCWHSSSHDLLASTSADGSCILWDAGAHNDMDIENGADHSNVLQKLTGHVGVVTKCDFHPMGRHIGTCGADYSWRLWDIETATELQLQDGHTKEVGSLAFQHDGALVLTGDYSGIALLWDVRSGQQIQAFQGHIKKIVNSSFNCNGFQVATGSADHTVRIWDLRMKKCGYTLPAHSNVISDVRFSKSGELLTTSSFDGSIHIWNARNYEILRSLTGHSGKVMCCDMSPDEKYVVSGGYDRTLKLWAHKTEVA